MNNDTFMFRLMGVVAGEFDSTHDLVGRLETISPDMRDLAACAMLEDAQTYSCRDRCGELFRVAHALDPARLPDDFFRKLVLLRVRLDGKRNAGPRPRTMERNVAIFGRFIIARSAGDPYEEVVERLASQFCISTNAVEVVLNAPTFAAMRRQLRDAKREP